MANIKFNMKRIRFILILIFFVVTVLQGFLYSDDTRDYIPIVSVLSLFIFVIFHGVTRYGIKNFLIFFMITWVVSHFFEALSIQTGFPFGDYYYDKLIGPRILAVPLIIIPAYFGMGYASWMLANILLRQYYQKLAGQQIFFIPLVATFIMVMWDVGMDPTASTIASLWVWKESGLYFGVPLQNYFGWFLVVYIFFQIFAFYIAKFDRLDAAQLTTVSQPYFWQEIVVVYGTQALGQILNVVSQDDYMEIYQPLAMITIFTMVFVTLIAFLTIRNSDEMIRHQK